MATTATTVTTTTTPTQSQQPTTTTTSASTIPITVDFTGGLEMLFSDIPSHKISVPSTNPHHQPFTIGDLIPWLCDNLMNDARKDLFVLNDAIRPGILVLINDADWELEGEDAYQLQARDNVLFVSTLHGG